MFDASNHSQNISWAKTIWHIAIPPSKSFSVWRLLHNKLPTYDNLIKRGSWFPSICDICGASQETSSHLFIYCPFATDIWHWLGSILNVNCNLTSYLDIIRISDRSWSPHCKLVILAAIVHCFHTIWHCKNQRRFNDKIIQVSSSINLIISGTSLTGNSTHQNLQLAHL